MVINFGRENKGTIVMIEHDFDHKIQSSAQDSIKIVIACNRLRHFLLNLVINIVLFSWFPNQKN